LVIEQFEIAHDYVDCLLMFSWLGLPSNVAFESCFLTAHPAPRISGIPIS